MRKNEYKKMYLLENTHFWFVAKRFFINTYLKKIKVPLPKILDLGSGTGGTTKFLESFGEVTGVEKNKIAVALARKRKLKIIHAQLEKLPLKNNEYDLVTLFDVLYHQDVLSIDKALNEAKRVLKINGFLLLTDSAFNFLSGRHGLEMQEKRRFTLTELKDILNKLSIKTVSSSYIYFSVFPLVFFKRLVLERFIKINSSDVFRLPGLVNNLLLNLLRLEAKLLNYFNFPLGSSLIILAQKND